MLATIVLISNPTIDVDANITLRVFFLFSVFHQVLYFVCCLVYFFSVVILVKLVYLFYFV
jgi:hypothetical protein